MVSSDDIMVNVPLPVTINAKAHAISKVNGDGDARSLYIKAICDKVRQEWDDYKALLEKSD